MADKRRPVVRLRRRSARQLDRALGNRELIRHRADIRRQTSQDRLGRSGIRVALVVNRVINALLKQRIAIFGHKARHLTLAIIDKTIRRIPFHRQLPDRNLLALDHEHYGLDLALDTVGVSRMRQLVPTVSLDAPHLHPFARQPSENRRAVLRDGDGRLRVSVPEIGEGQLLRPRRHAVALDQVQRKRRRLACRGTRRASPQTNRAHKRKLLNQLFHTASVTFFTPSPNASQSTP